MTQTTDDIQTGFFQAEDQTQLRYWYHAVKDPQATVVLLHGHGEHSGRYKKFIQELRDCRVNLASYDFRGHGESEGPHVYIETYEKYIQDVSSFIAHLRQEDLLRDKFILFGHSNGGLTAVHWAMRHSAELHGLVLSAPFLGLKLPAILRGLNHVMNTFFPKFVYKNPIYPPYLTHSEDELERYKADPYIRRKISARLLDQMLTYIRKLEAMTSYSFPFPCYILMSGEERVVDPDQTKHFYETLQCPDKDLTEFKGLYHEIFNELGQEKVFAKFVEYLERIIKSVNG